MSHSSISNSDRGDRAGLVLVPAEVASTGLARFAFVFSIMVFLFGIASALVVDRFWLSTPIKLRGEEALQEADLRRSAKIMDGSWAKLLEHDLRMNSGVRRLIIGPYAWGLYRWMGHVKEGVILGDDGWLFLRNRAEVSNEEKDKVIALAVANVAALERRLGALGLDTYVLPVPRKSVVHADLLPQRIDVRPELDRHLVDALKRHRIPTADVLEVFVDGLPEPAYHALGSHWADVAQLAAAEALVQVSGLEVPNEKSSTEVFSSKHPADRVDKGLLEYAGVYFEPKIPDFAKRKVYGVRLKNQNVKDRRVKLADQVGEVVSLGTSFTAQRMFPYYLSHFTNRPVWCGAKAGLFPGTVVARFLSEPEAMLKAKTVFLEIPNHFLLGSNVTHIIGDAFGAKAPPHTVVARELSSKEMLVGGGEVFKIGAKGKLLASVAGGCIAHSGDGALSIRIRGTTSVDLRARLIGGGTSTLLSVWPADQDEVVLPLISAGPVSGKILLRVSPVNASAGPAEVWIEGIDLVSELDHPGALQVPFEPTSTESGWRTSISFDGEGVLVGDLGVMHIELDQKGEPSDTVLVKAVVGSTNVTTRRIEFNGADSRCLLAIGLGPLRGERIRSVSLSGTGSQTSDSTALLKVFPDSEQNASLY